MTASASVSASAPASLFWKPNYIGDVDQSVVELRVGGPGPDGASYRFLYGLIGQASPYFKNCFRAGAFQEGQTRLLVVDSKFSKRTIQIFQQWLGSGSLDLPADSTEYFLKDDSPQCDGCWGFDLDEAIAQGQVTGTLVEWQTDLFNLVAFAAFYEVNLLSRDVVLKWQKLEEHWGSVPPYAIIKTTGERQDDEEPDLDRDHPFSKYLIERYRFIAKVEWINCGCRCCSNRSSPAPHRRTLPESFKAQMVSLDQTAPTSFNWCDFHGHKGDDEKIMCQEHRWSNSECSESEDFYQEYFMRDNPEAGAYNYDQPGYWADGGRK